MAMDKKYQVFISSTYEDLREERFAVMQSLLDFDCIPVGMEQFPASDMSQMEYIEKLIDECDYYLLILAGKYGSTDHEGVGYTEREYDYAISKGIPVMRHVIEDSSVLPLEKCEEDKGKKQKLEDFRGKVCDDRLVKFFCDIGSLKYNVVQTLNHYIKKYPRNGWVRSDSINVDDRLERNFNIFMEDYMKNYVMTAENIKMPFKEEVLVLDGGNAFGHIQREKENVISAGEKHVKNFLAENGGLTLRELAEKTGRTIPTTKRMIIALEEKGEVERESNGRAVTYRINKDG